MAQEGITFRVSYDPRWSRSLIRLARLFPREMRMAQGRAAGAARSQLRALMRSGGGRYNVPGFAPHAPISNILHPGRPIGGVLARPASIVAYRKGGVQHVGWAGSLAAYAQLLQRAESRPTDKPERHWMYMLAGDRRGLVPRVYSRPAREVIEPFSHHLAKEYPGWVLKNFEKLIKRTLARKL